MKTLLFVDLIMKILIFIEFIIICSLIAYIIIGVVVEWIIKLAKNQRESTLADLTAFTKVFDENTLVIPNGYYFDKTHTWALMEKDGKIKIGIDDFFQHVTGTLTDIKMKDPGEVIRKNEVFLSIIQNGKQLNIHSPISGTIKKMNTDLVKNSSIINSSPYTDGWVYIIEPTNWSKESQFMMMAEKATDWFKNEFIRLKDFLSVCLKAKNTPLYEGVVLQDGGALKDAALADLDAKVWEDLQINFIDNIT